MIRIVMHFISDDLRFFGFLANRFRSIGAALDLVLQRPFLLVLCLLLAQLAILVRLFIAFFLLLRLIFGLC